MKQKYLTGAIRASLLTLALPGIAVAQSVQLEELVVTAQKRASTAQDVPVALSVVNSEMIENMGLQDVSDLTKVSSSLTISEEDNQNQSPVALRGVGTYAFAIGVDPSVAVIVDDVPVATTGQAFANLNGVERIEVLRGPQSTLFGKSASAGVISLTTKAPTEEFAADVQLEATDDSMYRFSTNVSGPASDNVGYIFSAYADDYEGNLNNVATGGKLNASDGWGARGKLQIDASDDLAITLTADVNERNKSPIFVFRQVAEDASYQGIPASEWLVDGIEPGEGNFGTAANDEQPSSDSQDQSFIAKIDYSMGEHTLTSITGYRGWEYSHYQDADMLLEAADPSDFPDGGQNSWSEYELDQLTQELRISSPVSDTFDYILGLWYATTDTDRSFERHAPFGRSNWDASVTNESYAVFGQGTYHVSERVNLIAGLRYGKEEVEVDWTDNLATPITSLSGATDDDAVTGQLSLQYMPNDDITTYLSYAQGYKGPAYNTGSSFNQSQLDNPVGSEESESVELGMKGAFLDRRLTLDVALFQSEYDGFQAQSFVSDGTGGFESRLNNVGKLDISGIEVDLTALVGDNLRVNLGVAAIDATIDEFTGAPCYELQTAAEGCIVLNPSAPVWAQAKEQDLSGAPLNNSPDLKFTLGWDYSIPLENQSFDLAFRGNYEWQDDIESFSLDQDPLLAYDAYGILDLSLALVDKGGRYEVTAYLNNALDEYYVTNLFNRSGNWPGSTPTILQQVPRDAERHAGLRLKYNF